MRERKMSSDFFSPFYVFIIRGDFSASQRVDIFVVISGQSYRLLQNLFRPLAKTQTAENVNHQSGKNELRQHLKFKAISIFDSRNSVQVHILLPFTDSSRPFNQLFNLILVIDSNRGAILKSTWNKRFQNENLHLNQLAVLHNRFVTMAGISNHPVI